MADIKQGQLVRIVEIHPKDWTHWNRDELIGMTGRFVEYTRPDMLGYNSPKSYISGTWGGQFEFVPDFLNDNADLPVFHAVYVEPVDEP